jgi:hypothetical protein
VSIVRTTIVIDAASRSALRALSREFERITAYDGSTIQITFENAVPSLPPLIRAPGTLQDAVSGALSAADAATSSWYRKGPIGKPYDVRIRAASQTLRSEFDSMYRSLSASSGPQLFTNRQQYMDANRDALGRRFGTPRGPLEASFRKMLTEQNVNGRD